MKRSGNWIFLGLLVVASILFLVSFSMPWWTATITQSNGVKIYGWGLRHNLTALDYYVAADETPMTQTALAWLYVAASIVVIWAAALLMRRWHSLLLFIVGLGYAIYPLVAIFMVVKNRIAYLDLPLQGATIKGPGGGVSIRVETSLEPGFYLALATGLYILALSLVSFIMKRWKRVAGNFYVL